MMNDGMIFLRVGGENTELEWDDEDEMSNEKIKFRTMNGVLNMAWDVEEHRQREIEMRGKLFCDLDKLSVRLPSRIFEIRESNESSDIHTIHTR